MFRVGLLAFSGSRHASGTMGLEGRMHELAEDHGSPEIARTFKTRSAVGLMRVDEQ